MCPYATHFLLVQVLMADPPQFAAPLFKHTNTFMGIVAYVFSRSLN
jgi:hypothetical protein